MTEPEFSRPIRLDTLGTAPRSLTIAAEKPERAALARRFGLLALDSLEAELTLVSEGGAVTLTGRLRAKATQACTVSGAPVPTAIDEPIILAFRPLMGGSADEEIELGESDMDVQFHDGTAIDVGEAVAQSLALALDPYPRAPDAEAALKEAGVTSEAETGPFAALAALKGKP
jgi:uncharacterized metal-binding protein YceD (DUF177 family)